MGTELAQVARTFIAIPVEEHVKTALSRTVERMKKTDTRVKWVVPENIHLTLAFIGDINNEELSAISVALDSIGTHNAPFEIEAHGTGCFGGRHFPRIIWAGLKGMLNPLFSLQEQVVTALATLHILVDEKKFKPHITLGRVRSPKNADALMDTINAHREVDYGSFTVNELHLMKSVIGPNGAEYETLHCSKLS